VETFTELFVAGFFVLYFLVLAVLVVAALARYGTLRTAKRDQEAKERQRKTAGQRKKSSSGWS
jgi:type III secretory pathway component EscV